MNDPLIILAKSGLDSLLNALAIVVIMVIVGVSQLMAKRKKEQQREEQQRKDLARGKPLDQADEVDRQELDLRQPRQQALPQRRGVRRDLRQPRAAASGPIILTEAEDQEVEQVVEDELRREQQRQARGDADRQRRLAEPKSLVGQRKSVATIRPHVPHVQPEEWRTSEDAAGRRLEVDLADLQAAQRAIIFHEILSPPKALRQEAEMWDT